MKKKTIWKSPNMMPNKKKEILKFVNDPEKMKKMMDLVKTSNNVVEKIEKTTIKNLDEWFTKIVTLLPEEYVDNTEFINDLKNLIEKYKLENT